MPIKRREWRKIRVTSDGDAFNFDTAEKIQNSLKDMRGKFIDVSQAIMMELEYCMSIFDAPIPESDKGDQDMEAWKAWRQELHKVPELKRVSKGLRREVHRSITQRNKYVHGILGWNNNDPYLEYEKEGKMVQEPFDILIMEKEYQEMIGTVDNFRILNVQLTREKNQ